MNFISLVKNSILRNSEPAAAFVAGLEKSSLSLFDVFSSFTVNDIINMPAAKITQLIESTSAAIKLLDSSLANKRRSQRFSSLSRESTDCL